MSGGQFDFIWLAARMCTLKGRTCGEPNEIKEMTATRIPFHCKAFFSTQI